MRIIRADDQTFVPASHEDPRSPGVLKRVIATRNELIDGQVQMINWARLPVGRSFQAHYHEDMEEVFVMVRGTARMTVAGHDVMLAAGDTICVAPHEVHRMTNAGSEDVEYLVLGISTGQGGKTVVVE